MAEAEKDDERSPGEDVFKLIEDSPHVTIAAALVVFLLISLLIRHDVTTVLFNIVVIGSAGLLTYLSFSNLQSIQKDKWNILPALIGLALLAVALQSPGDVLLIILLTSYMVLAVVLAGKLIKLQTAIIIGIALTAIIFRVYPALPGSGATPGHLISMDDPYYHFKQADRLYTLGDVPEKDLTIYPPEGRPAPQKFPYYYNVYLALMTGNPIRDVILLYPILISAFGAVIMYFFLKELTNDWKSGMLGGFFFATMPVLLTKSAAGAVEEDVMGMVLGIFSLYLLAKAIKASGRDNIKYGLLAGIAFFITSISWKGEIFLYAIPFTALGLYALISIPFKYDIWDTTRAALIAGAIPILGEMTLINPGRINLSQVGPYGALLFLGFLAELIRLKVWKGEDSKTVLEKKYFTQIAVIVIIGSIIAIGVLGVDRFLSVPQSTLGRITGTSINNFLVDKTISEQAALSRGDLLTRLGVGYTRYNIAEPLTVIMAVLIPPLLVYYFFKDLDRMFEVLRAYIICLVFFLIAMEFVWVEARLAFSQSLGFLLLGSMAGLILPATWKEMGSWKVITLLVIIILIPFTTFYPHEGSSAWKQIKRPSSVDPNWFEGVKWLDENIDPGQFSGDQYINGDYVLTWWDYGHFITALSRATVIADPLQADESYIMRIARFFYNTTSEAEGMKWLMEQPWNQKDPDGGYKVKYIILDYSLIGKAGALSFLGTNYYQYPNGNTAVDGVCEVGELCQNVENGLAAEKTDEGYVCSEGVVCERDQLARLEQRMCCEPNPTQCCEMSLDWRVVKDRDGSAKLLRAPGTPVYGQYELVRGSGAICRPEFSTSLEPTIFVDDGERKTAVRRYLYTGFSGLRYGDGNDYPAFLLLEYADGSQDIKFITANCDISDYTEVMASGKDRLQNMGYGIRLSENVVAPQIFIHIPDRWMDSMFTQLYLFDAKDMDYFTLILNEDTRKFYPGVKIYSVTYPDEVPEVSEEETSEGPEEEPSMSQLGAGPGDKVEVDYTGRFENGTVFDTSAQRGPLGFTIGAGEVIKGFDNAVIGMQLGETKTVTVPPSEGYGEEDEHPLAGKTLVFDIKLVSLNGEAFEEEGSEEAESNETQSELNMTFDGYDPSLTSEYSLKNFPTVVWNCGYKKVGMLTDSGLESDSLKRLTCIMNKAQPSEVCEPLGVTYDESGVKLASNVQEVLNLLNELEGTEPCIPGENQSILQVFYPRTCADCETQKPLLDELDEEFGEYAGVEYYCVGDETYCQSNLAS